MNKEKAEKYHCKDDASVGEIIVADTDFIVTFVYELWKDFKVCWLTLCLHREEISIGGSCFFVFKWILIQKPAFIIMSSGKEKKNIHTNRAAAFFHPALWKAENLRWCDAAVIIFLQMKTTHSPSTPGPRLQRAGISLTASPPLCPRVNVKETLMTKRQDSTLAAAKNQMSSKMDRPCAAVSAEKESRNDIRCMTQTDIKWEWRWGQRTRKDWTTGGCSLLTPATLLSAQRLRTEHLSAI